MAGKQQTPAPISRPLSRAYLREFAGWSTAYPPGVSEPTSLRLMENVLVNRDGSARVRPGLRYLSWDQGTGDVITPFTVPASGINGFTFVGSHDSFYLDDGRKALLVALREDDLGTPENAQVIFTSYIYDPDADPDHPYRFNPNIYLEFGEPDIYFGAFPYDTTYVRYLQIDNKIVALSNNGETARLFYVGNDKKLVQPSRIPDERELDDVVTTTQVLIHPDAAWINGTQADDTGATAETATTNTLISSTASDNQYAVAVFYTFSNDFGESSAYGPPYPSGTDRDKQFGAIQVVRVQRPWTSWKWETANASGEPSGTTTGDPSKCADQLFFRVQEDYFNAAITAGALKLNVYVASWSDQEVMPVEAVLVASRDIVDANLDALDYNEAGWVQITPAVPQFAKTAPMPNAANFANYSAPPTNSQGIVAADRLVLVHDPLNPAQIKWTSGQSGNYLDFTAHRGGGIKTLTSGNLQIPASIKLWQNPQSVDTLTILCDGVDGHSTSYYMAPAQIAQQSEATNIMSFEETTATPGTVSPYGCEVALNALYHPLEDQLMKSTASNYNINHKAMTDNIADQWQQLEDKHQIVSCLHENRIYYIVNNPEGEALEDGAMGNEVWVLDIQAKTPTWSRWLVQACSLRLIEVNSRIYLSVVRPKGIWYFDPEYDQDDVVGWDGVDYTFGQEYIPWKLETNTQGANRAHDAWCRLVQANVTLGFFQGQMRYGIRGHDRHGKTVDVSKIVRDTDAPGTEAWDLEDFLHVNRDLREWFFYAESVETAGVVEQSSGQISMVQYRYTPISVNVGYAYGSVETFEYGIAGNAAADRTTVNGVPMPYIDTSRP